MATTFISLQIKEFCILSLSINESVYSCLFFFLTGLHFFHLIICILFSFLFPLAPTIITFLKEENVGANEKEVTAIHLVHMQFSFIFLMDGGKGK